MIANPEPLMRQYLDGKPDLTNDEREILLYALYLESVKNGGLAAKILSLMRSQESDSLTRGSSHDPMAR